MRQTASRRHIFLQSSERIGIATHSYKHSVRPAASQLVHHGQTKTYRCSPH
jgi:hypothetical protein